jgi:hypothetical protein
LAVKSKYSDDDGAATAGAGNLQADAALLDSLGRYRNLDLRCCGLSTLEGLHPRAFANLQVIVVVMQNADGVACCVLIVFPV